MPVLETVAAAAVASLVSISGLAVAGVASAQGGTTSPGTATLVAQKLAANLTYPYTQVTLSIPRLVGHGVNAREAAIATGLRLVVDEPRVKALPASTPSQLDLYYKAADLAELRSVRGNVYLFANLRNWAALPAPWTVAARRELAILDLGYGERWFAVPQATLLKLAQKGATRMSIGAGELKRLKASSKAVRAAESAALAGFVQDLSFTQSPAAGGNLVFRSSAPLQKLATGLVGIAAAIGQAMPGGSATVPVGTPGRIPGSYTLLLSTAGRGAYISRIQLALGVPGSGSITLQLGIAHAVEPVLVPEHVTVVPAEAFTGAAR